MVGSRSQSALEYLVTYGWVVIVVVIVVAILFSLGLFNPASSVGSTVSGFSGFSNALANCQTNGALELSLSNAQDVPVNVTEVNVTATVGASGTTVLHTDANIQPGASYNFLIQNVCPTSAGTRYSVTARLMYLQDSQLVLPGPYFSSGGAQGTTSSGVAPAYALFVNNRASPQWFWCGPPGCSPGFWGTDGGHSYMSATNSITGYNQTYTVLMWFNTNYSYGITLPSPNGSTVEPSANGEAIFTFSPGATGYQGDGFYSGTVFFHRCSSADTGLPAIASDMFDGHWHFVAFQVKGTNYFGQIDGASATTTNTHQYSSGNTIYVGNNWINYCDSDPFTGYIANVQLYNIALTPAQINQAFNEGILGTPVVTNSSLVAWWPMNGTVGNYVKDYSGHGFNGTLVNATITGKVPLAPIGH